MTAASIGAVTKPRASLFLFHVGTNAGYAITHCERLFHAVGRELANGNPDLVHFGYKSLEGGPPTFLPAGFRNVVAFDFADLSVANLARIGDYVKAHGIELAVIFDIQPLHPLFGVLKAAGVQSSLAYWGAPVSSLMPGWKLLLKRIQVALSRSKADGMIFESQAMADTALFGRGIPATEVDVVPLGVDTERWQPGASGHVHAVLNFPPDRKVIVYAGHMEARKGVRVLVEAAMELLMVRKRTDVCFLMCGNIRDQSAPFEALYAGSGVESLIRFGGYRSDLPLIYQGCYCGVIPSTGWDSYTFTSLEMASCGLPVVVSKLQGLAEAVQDGITGLHFRPGDVGALADTLERLLDDRGLRDRLGSAGRDRCVRELSLEAQQRRLLSVCRKRLSAK